MYRLLLRTFPASFRREFGAEMAQVFEARRRDARHDGLAAYLVFWARTIVDVIQHGLAERRAAALGRGDSPLQSFVQDTRIAVRLLGRRPTFAATAVLTLALGIGINVAVFSVMNGVLFQWLPLPSPEQLVKVGQTSARGTLQSLNVHAFAVLRDGTRPEFDHMAAYSSRRATLTGLGDATQVSTAVATSEFFDLLAAPPLMGRVLTAQDDATPDGVAVVSYTFWRSRLGADPLAIGRTLELDSARVVVVGVMPKGVVFPEQTDIWRPVAWTPAELSPLQHVATSVVGRLAPGVSLTVANAALVRAGARIQRTIESDRQSTPAAVGLRDAMVADMRRDLAFVQMVAVVVLLIGCANLANLLLASASVRQREMAVRASIGASRQRLIRQLLAESLVLSTLGGFAGLLVAMWIVPLAVEWYPDVLPGAERVGVGLTEFGVAMLIASAVTVVIGLVPAISASHADLSSVLRAGPVSSPSRLAHRFRWTLVIAEVVLALSVVTGAALLVRNYARLTLQPIGFDSHAVLTAQLTVPVRAYPTPATQSELFDRILRDVQGRPGVEAAALTAPMLFDRAETAMMFYAPRGANAEPAAIPSPVQRVSPQYLDVFKIPLVRGRFFTATDSATSAPVVVVSERLAQQIGGGADVIGMQLGQGAGTPPLTIIGIVADARVNFYQQPKATAFLPMTQATVASAKIAVRTTQRPNAFAPVLRDVVHSQDPRLPIVLPVSLDSVVRSSVAARIFNMMLMGSLAAMALLLSVIGIYGVMTFIAAQRTREIGIRIALGAQPNRVQTLMIRQAMAPIAIGVAIGSVGAWMVTSLLKKELWEVRAHDPWVMSTAVCGFLIVGLIACWVPSRRVSRVNPIQVLRAD